ncbi:MAG TPA: SRPBCC family protein [Vulgatibacter sp.]|nr:SRPBCC family protein [Vulgatibacter sp.]
MIKKISYSLAVIVAIAVVVIATRPSSFSIERSRQIEAPPEVAFGFVDDLHRWSGWSPWEKMDPQMTRTFEGAESGVGAIYAWKGNDQVGEGRMTITASQPNELVEIQLEFLKPWAASNRVIFRFTPNEDGTNVVWRMEGENDFFGKAFSMFFDMDAMVGKDFDEGLASLGDLAKAEAEKRAAEEKKRQEEEAAAAAEAAEAAEATEEGAVAREE